MEAVNRRNTDNTMENKKKGKRTKNNGIYYTEISGYQRDNQKP